MPDTLAVAKQRLAVPQHGVGGVDADEPMLGLGGAQPFERLAADEVDRLAARDGEPEPGCERIDERADVVAPRAEATLDARGVERECAGVA